MSDLEFIQDHSRGKEQTRVYPLSTRGETSGFERKFIGKTTKICIYVICVIKQQSVDSSSVHLFTGGEKQHGQDLR